MESEASHQHPYHSKLTNHESILTIPILPAELVTEILSRLPVKSLLQFTCVSKSWLSLISSPEFIKTHLSLSANNKDYTHHKVMMSPYPRHTSNVKVCSLRSLFYDSGIQTFDLDCPMISYGRYWYKHDDVYFVGSVNGLICLLNQDNEYFIWNPSIRKYKKLSNPRLLMRVAYRSVSGFGYDELHDDYKVVVSFYSSSTDPDCEVMIYSLKSDSWRSRDNGGRELANGRGMFVNGKLHWTTTSDDYCFNHNSKNIISFDLADEKWGMVEEPCYEEVTSFLKVGVLNTDLSVSGYKRGYIDVRVMMKYGVKESWMKILAIKYHDGFLSPPFFMSNKGEILVMLRSTFRIYMKHDTFKDPEFINFDGYCEAEIYLESLICPFSTRGDR